MTLIIILKQLHIALAITSITFFLIRFLGRQLDAGFMRTRIIRVAPHIIDTLLLASGIALATLYRLSPLDADWLLVKLILIVGYIVAGVFAMKSKSELRRSIYALLALSLIFGAVFMAVLKPI